ncbi:MAG: hypothetical protein ACRDVL_05340, partial [Acidimicrobiia bacterium]
DSRRLTVPGWRWLVLLLRVVGVAGLSLVVAAGLFGVDDSGRNPSSVLVWVVFWLVVPFAAAFVGNVYRLMGPWDSLARLGRLGSEEPTPNPGWGLWPATVLFVSFTWFELIYPDPSAPRLLALAAIVYTAVLLVAYEYLGRTAVSHQVDAFAVYNRLISGIAPLDLDPENGPGWRGWLRELPHLAEVRGLTVFVVAMIGTVSYDGISATGWYDETFGAFGSSIVGGSILLILSVLLVAAAYWTACGFAARSARADWTGRTVARRFAHTLVPIAFAYAFAHYFTLVLFEGQLLISTISDPLGLGWDLFGTVDRGIDFTLISPVGVWWVQVFVIVAGHVAGVVLAHDRALADFGSDTSLRSQYAMLGLMVVLTGLGLTILAAG